MEIYFLFKDARIFELQIFLTDKKKLESINRIRNELFNEESLDSYFINNFSPVTPQINKVPKILKVMI